MARSSDLASLGLGSFSSSRESLVGTGIALLWNAVPFGIGVSRTQYIYAVLIPLLALLIARTSGGQRPLPGAA